MPGSFRSSWSCFKCNCLLLPTRNCTERLMPVIVKGGFLSLRLMAVLLCWWLLIYLLCLQLLAAVARRLAAVQCYFLYVFHRIICLLFQENINIIMQFISLINERSKSTHFSSLHSLYSISYSCRYSRVFELITHLEIFIPMWKRKHIYIISLTFTYHLLQETEILGKNNFATIKYVWQSDVLSLCVHCDPWGGSQLLSAMGDRSVIGEYKLQHSLCGSQSCAQNTVIHFRD